MITDTWGNYLWQVQGFLLLYNTWEICKLAVSRMHFFTRFLKYINVLTIERLQ